MKQPQLWKTAIMIWMGIYPTITILLYFLWPLVKDFPLPVKTLCLTIIAVPVMVWLVLPLLQKILKNWLQKNKKTINMQSQNNSYVQLVMSGWNTQNKRLTETVNSLTDEQLSHEIAPGRNTGIYLLGHLIAVSDYMLPLLGFGERLYPEMEEVFLKNPDKSGLVKPAVSTLKEYLAKVNDELNRHIQSLAPEEWLQKHTLVSAEDFAKEPHRNKLNIIINRTNHMSYHLGQMALLQ